MTRYEKLISGAKEDLVNEFVLAMKWVRDLPAEDWMCLVDGCPGLEGLMLEVLDTEV